jgi:hypothetical protein
VGRKLMGSTVAKLIAVAAAVTVVASVAGAFVVLTRPGTPLASLFGQAAAPPPPVVTVQSAYYVGALPAGSTSTQVRISGREFANQAAVTFLLNGQPAPGAEPVKSDGQGRVQADLTITADWPLGTETLSARDAQGHRPAHGVEVAIVPQGQANTPGPNGAPPDDASFMFSLYIEPAISGICFYTCEDQDDVVLVTGHPDPAGGTACGKHDDGQPYTWITLLFTATRTTTCSGSYQGGKLTYTQMVVQVSVPDCTTSSSPDTMSFEGTFVSSTRVSGTLTVNKSYIITCIGDIRTVFYPGQPITWVGSLITSP